MVLIEFQDESFYMEQQLSNDLDKIIEAISNQQRDYVLLVDGNEGDGKSTLAQQVACKVDNSFCVERMCFSPREFVEAVNKAEKNHAIVFDESFHGLSSRAAMSMDNKLIVNTLMRVRAKCLFIILVIPTVFMLDKYATLWRAKGLINVRSDIYGKRGYFLLFNQKALRLLYEKGKKTFSYKVPKATYVGRFYGKWVIDKKKYDIKKNSNLIVDIDGQSEELIYLKQRNIAIKIIKEQTRLTDKEIAELLTHKGMKITQQGVNYALKTVKTV